MDEARKKSRVQYLRSRAAKQVDIFEEDLKDAKVLVQDKHLSKREKSSLEFREQVLTLTKNQIDASQRARSTHHYLPDETVEIDDNNDNKHDIKSRDTSHQTEVQDYNFDLIMDDHEFLERVKRGDTFEEERIDIRKQEREEKQRSFRILQENKRKLPVYTHRDDLLQAISENQIIIIQGETGCGKTTQLPQYLHEAGYTKTELKDGETKIVGCTQPRRVAAMSVAARVSQEVGSKLGHSVGYSIRFEDCTSEGTVIKYMTDGMLLREFLDDPKLSSYSVIIVDEAHERTLHTDILLTLLKDVTRSRQDFRLIISSATLDEQKFSKFFGDPPTFKIQGRLFKVHNRFMANDQKIATANMIDASLRTILQIHRADKPGDILVFLPGQEEIEELQKELELQVKALGSTSKEMIIRPIYANLPTDMQSKVFEKTPPRARKVVIATNIAETSITIDGIVFVVDPGYCKQNHFSHKTGMETLAITRISKASADQRAGRAGRNREGMCFRLYTKEEFASDFEENTQPEIQRLNLANVVLLLKTMNIDDVINFDYIDRPVTGVLNSAVEQLTALGALDNKGQLTELGRKMAEFPLDPRMSKAIICAETHGCTAEIITIMSMLTVNASIFFKPKDKAVHAEASRKSFFSITGDHLMLLKVYNDWVATEYDRNWCYETFIQYKSMCRARDIRNQLEKLAEKVELKLMSEPKDSEKILKALLGGFFHQVARVSRDAGSFRTIKQNQTVYIHPTSALYNCPPMWVMFNEIKQTSKEYLRVVSEIDPAWLADVAPSYYEQEKIDELSKRRKPRNTGKSRQDLRPKVGPPR